MIDNVVAALGLGLNLTDEEIADVLWLAVQMQQFGDGVISEQGDRNEALENSGSNRESPKQPAQPLRDADRDRQDENKKDEQNFEVHSKNAQNDDRSTRRSDELQLKIPDARSLQEPLELARSLRPLMRRVPSQVNTLLDEEATVRRIAEEKIWCPVLRPALEPWLDLALVIDDSASMLMWRHTIAELQHFLSSYGVFRDVRVWRLGTDKTEKVCIYAGATASDRNGSPRSPSELIEANGRGLVLVVSDCIAPIWRNGAIATALQIWSRSGMVAILQMLPDWLWARTALGRGVAAQFSALAAGIPNYQLTTTTVSTWYDIDLATSIKIPVVTLEPDKFTAWAEMLAGKGGAWSAGIVFEPELFAGQEVAIEFDGASELDAEDRVQSFRLTASPIARRLAGLLAAAPVISLPIVRILQSKVLTQSQPVHVAEVFLGGLLKPLSEITAKTNPNYVQYDFIEGVRDLLLDSVPSSEIVNVVAEVSEYIAERLGVSLEEFAAVIRNPRQVQNTEILSQTVPFAILTAKILKRLGGEYVRFAEEVERAIEEVENNPPVEESKQMEIEQEQRGKYALLVGINNYTDLNSIPSSEQDVQSIYQVLTDPNIGNFAESNVTVLIDAEKESIETAIYDLFTNRKNDDLLLFYFSGHAVVDDRDDFYLLGVSSRKDAIPPTAVFADYVHLEMSESRSKNQVVILDCSYSGAFAERMTLNGQGGVILTSSSSIQKAFNHEGSNLSLYTHFLVEGLRTGMADINKDGYISVYELHEYVRDKIKIIKPSMSPSFYPIKEGHRIILAKALQNTLKLESREYEKTATDSAKEIPAQIQGGRYALLIGISNYTSDLNPLPSAVRDVEALRQVLIDPDIGGFLDSDVTVLMDAKKGAIETAIHQLFSNRKKDDLLLFYFSGHGVVDSRGDFYLTSLSTRKNALRPTAVSSGYVHRAINDSRSRHQVVVLDCCFSGAFSKGMLAKSIDTVNVLPKLGGEGRAIMTASESSQYTFEQEGFDLSLYTHFFVEGLRTGIADLDEDGYVSVGELHEYVQDKLRIANDHMSPSFYPVKEGYRIVLAKAKADSKLKFRREVEKVISRNNGKISSVSKALLAQRQKELGLIPIESQTIINEVLRPYSGYIRKLEEYEQYLLAAIAEEFPLSEVAQTELQDHEKHLNLSDEDIKEVKNRVINNIKIPLGIRFDDPELDDAELNLNTVQILEELRDSDDIETVERVPVVDLPEGNKSIGGFLSGLLKAEVNVGNLKKVIGFLSDRMGNRQISFEVEANGVKMKISANNREELESAIKAAQMFTDSLSSPDE